jgi:tRNA-dihydrouridine synthase B
MRLGNIELSNNLILAPMAGVTDAPFRLLAKKMGAGLVYSEMIIDQGLIYNNPQTLKMLHIDPVERPVAIQIFGSDPSSMAEAAKIVEEAGADIIDINMGCPTPKIVKNGEGSALMKTPELAFSIMKAVVAAVRTPVTVKIRKGWDKNSVNAVQMASLAEEAGVVAVSVHGRTREQFYSGRADWSIVRAVKEKISIPVILSGDITSPKDARRAFLETGCDALMIGRAARGNMWIFKNILHYLKTGIVLDEPTIDEKIAMLLKHLDMLVEHKGEYTAIREMRSHGAWYTKGMPNSSVLRLLINNAASKEDFISIINEYAKCAGGEETC